MRREPGKRRAKPAKPSASQPSPAAVCPANWPIARTVTRPTPSCISSRGTPPAARPSKAATESSQPFCRFAASCLTCKKRAEYVDDDPQLNRILIQLGTEEVRLRNLQDEKELSQKQLSEILELLEALDKYADGLRKKGGDFAVYLEHRDSQTHVLPQH